MKKWSIVLVLAALLLTMLLTSCYKNQLDEADDNSETWRTYGWHQTVARVVDREAEVVCYIYKNLDAGGIDCLPFSALSPSAMERLGL